MKPFSIIISVLICSASAGETQTVRGMVTHCGKGFVVVATESGPRHLLKRDEIVPPATGDCVTIDCRTEGSDDPMRPPEIVRIDVTGKGRMPDPIESPLTRILADRLFLVPIRTQGRIEETFQDEIDTAVHLMTLRSGGSFVYVSLPRPFATEELIRRLDRAEVEVTGVCFQHAWGTRKFTEPLISLTGADAIRILRPAPEDPFDAPPVAELTRLPPSGLAARDRHRAEGIVLATWGRDNALLRADDGTAFRIELAEGEALPSPGDHLLAVGHPETDLFRINLSNARCRRLPSRRLDEPPPEAIRPEDILTNARGDRRVRTDYFGRTVTFEGTVRSLPKPGNADGRLNLDCGRVLVPIDVSSCPDVLSDIAIGSVLRVTGICLLESDNWRPGNPFPKIRGLSLVLRDARDVRILSSPSWWTAQRLLFAIGTLLVLLVGVAIWNRILNRLVTSRSRALLKEQIAHTVSELKVGERTRLAVELHDSLSQNLTGVACQVAAIGDCLGEDDTAARERLQTAERMLKSCRTELRYCLFDLRSDTLEERDFAQAIRKTLSRVCGDAEVSVRCDVSRAHLLDSTAHAILCIVRELAANAVRHGAARHIAVEGAATNGVLAFSVSDDGSGFDPAHHPGSSEGHFGLDGIRDRVQHLNGTFTIANTKGGGVRACVSIPVPNPSEGSRT